MNTENPILQGKSDVENSHVRLNEGNVASAWPRRGFLRYRGICCVIVAFAALLTARGEGWDFSAGDFQRAAGETDDTPRLERLLKATGPHGVAYLPKGVYEITRTLMVTNGESLTLHKSAVLKAVQRMDYVVRIDLASQWGKMLRKDGKIHGAAFAAQGRQEDYNFAFIGGTVDGNALASCLVLDNYHHFTLRDASFLNGREYGLDLGRYGHGYEVIANNLYFKTTMHGCKGNVAIMQREADSHFTDCVIVDYTVGVRTTGGSNRYTRCHVWGGPVREMLEDSINYDVNGGWAIFRDCYCDTGKIGFRINGGGRILGCQYFANKIFGLEDITCIEHRRGPLLVSDTLFIKTADKMRLYAGCGDVQWTNCRATGGFAREEIPWEVPPKVAAPFKDGDRVVFFGDSITHHGGYHEQIALYYATRFPDRDVWFSNSGESGGSADGALRRLGEDVVMKKPTVVSVMFGMNDIWRNFWPRSGATVTNQNKNLEAITAYKCAMTNLVRQVRARGGNPEIVYITPSPYDQTCLIDGKPSDTVCNDGLAILGDWVRQQAAADGATCVDLQAYLRELNAREQAKDPAWSFMRTGHGSFDRIHPTTFGHQFFAYRFLKTQNAPAEVSTVQIDAQLRITDGTRNAAVSNVRCGADGVTLTVHERALPYPYTDQTTAALAYAPIVDELNREMLRVSGLSEGTYVLSIDGAEICRTTAVALAVGINLATNAITPMCRQAERVRLLNERLWKTQINVRDVRMWRLWKTGRVPVENLSAYRAWYEQEKTAGRMNGWDGYMAKQYLDHAANLDGLEEDCERLRKELRAAAQPVPHVWSLTRVTSSNAAN